MDYDNGKEITLEQARAVCDFLHDGLGLALDGRVDPCVINNHEPYFSGVLFLNSRLTKDRHAAGALSAADEIWRAIVRVVEHRSYTQPNPARSTDDEREAIEAGTFKRQ